VLNSVICLFDRKAQTLANSGSMLNLGPDPQALVYPAPRVESFFTNDRI
jgi:hypothetical protein